MTTTNKTPRVKKPDAEMIGNFWDFMEAPDCTEGRSVYRFQSHDDADTEIFVRAASGLQAWKAIHFDLGTMEKMTKDKMTARYRQAIEVNRNGNQKGRSQQ